MARKRSDSGEFVESVTLAAVVEVFGEVEGPVVTSADVADALGCSRETARRKLRQLHQEGRVDRRKTAGRVVWWRTDERPPSTADPEIDPDAPLFTGDPFIDADLGDETIDDVLYGPIETDEESETDGDA